MSTLGVHGHAHACTHMRTHICTRTHTHKCTYTQGQCKSSFLGEMPGLGGERLPFAFRSGFYLCLYLFIHSFDKYLLRTCSGSITGLGAWAPVLSKVDLGPALQVSKAAAATRSEGWRRESPWKSY